MAFQPVSGPCPVRACSGLPGDARCGCGPWRLEMGLRILMIQGSQRFGGVLGQRALHGIIKGSKPAGALELDFVVMPEDNLGALDSGDDWSVEKDVTVEFMRTSDRTMTMSDAVAVANSLKKLRSFRQSPPRLFYGFSLVHRPRLRHQHRARFCGQWGGFRMMKERSARQ